MTKSFLIKTAPTLHEFKFVEFLNQKIELQLLQSFIVQPQSIEAWVRYLTTESSSRVRIIHSPLSHGEDIDWDDLVKPHLILSVG